MTCVHGDTRIGGEMSNKEKKYNEEIVTENENTCETKKGIINAPGYAGINLRSEPSTESEVLKVMKEGEEIEILDEEHLDFYAVCTADGFLGYCMKAFVIVC